MLKVHKEKNFMTFFDKKTGCYMRTGVIVDGKDTGKDPFMASFPELLDIGIMGHCKHGQSGLCIKAGVECYQNGFYSDMPNMKLDDFEELAKQCQGKTYQFALGGCGDPDQHEHFVDILKICRKYDIVPNFTTSGLGITKEIAKICKEYCGAVAVSWYRSDYTYKAIDLLINEGVRTNIHYVINKNTVSEAVQRLKEKSFPSKINAIVFLLHKPVGLGTYENMIMGDNIYFQQLIEYISGQKTNYKVGFDSCTIPALVNNIGTIDIDSLDTCEGGRWSAYVTPDMKLLPCSFDNQQQRWAVDLRNYSIKEAWDSIIFDDFRNHFIKACPKCKKREHCMGGCPIEPEIVLCEEKKTKGTCKQI